MRQDPDAHGSIVGRMEISRGLDDAALPEVLLSYARRHHPSGLVDHLNGQVKAEKVQPQTCEAPEHRARPATGVKHLTGRDLGQEMPNNLLMHGRIGCWRTVVLIEIGFSPARVAGLN